MTNSTPTRILIIEDTPLNLQLIADLLERAGHVVLTATDATEGIAVARSERPDLILMDIGLPGMDGLEAARRLKADPLTKRIPVVVLSAHALPADERRARAAGCDGYITKPIDTRSFQVRIKTFLGSGARSEECEG